MEWINSPTRTRKEWKPKKPINGGHKLTIHELLRFTAEAGASDLHIAAGAHPMVRVNGKMKRLNLPIL